MDTGPRIRSASARSTSLSAPTITQTNGGGWVPDAGSANGKGNFGFTVKGDNGIAEG